MTPSKIKKTRTVLGLSIQKLADLIGVDDCTVKNWESGKHGMSDQAKKKFKSVIKKRLKKTISIIERALKDEQ